MSSSRYIERFTRSQIEVYEKSRYRGLDQRIVDRRERRKVRRCLLRILGRGLTAPVGSAAHSGTAAHRREGRGPGAEGAIVLDAPCGYGRMFEIAAEAAGPNGRLICADLSDAMVARTMVRAGASVMGKNAVRPLGVAGDILAGIPLKDAAADVVLCLRLFHHLHRAEDRRAALGEMARVARIGAVVSFYRENRLHAFQRRIRARLKGRRYEVCMIPGPTFEAEAASAGFRIVEIAPLFRGFHAQVFAVLEKRA